MYNNYNDILYIGDYIYKYKQRERENNTLMASISTFYTQEN